MLRVSGRPVVVFGFDHFGARESFGTARFSLGKGRLVDVALVALGVVVAICGCVFFSNREDLVAGRAHPLEIVGGTGGRLGDATLTASSGGIALRGIEWSGIAAICAMMYLLTSTIHG